MISHRQPSDHLEVTCSHYLWVCITASSPIHTITMCMIPEKERQRELDDPLDIPQM